MDADELAALPVGTMIELDISGNPEFAAVPNQEHYRWVKGENGNWYSSLSARNWSGWTSAEMARAFEHDRRLWAENYPDQPYPSTMRVVDDAQH